MRINTEGRMVLGVILALLIANHGMAVDGGFGSGTVVVAISGSNSDPLGDPGIAPLTLAEFTTTGLATGFHVALPTADTPVASGTNYAMAGSQSATSIYGALKRSADGRFLTISAANVPAATVSGSLPGGVFGSASFQNRTIARIDADGTVDATTRFIARGTTPRGAASTDGTAIWWSADSGTLDAGGVRYLTLGGTVAGPQLTGVGLSTDSRSNTTGIGIFSDQLYVAYNVSTFRGVYALGSGLPVSGGPLVASTIVGGTSVTDFFFANPETLYVAVSGTDPTMVGLGLQKWAFSSQSQTWSNVWTQNPAGALGIRTLTGSVVDGTVNLYAITLAGTSASIPNALLGVTDTLGGVAFPGGGFSTLATAEPSTLFRGVALAPVPEPTTAALVAGAIGASLIARCRGNKGSPLVS